MADEVRPATDDAVAFIEHRDDGYARIVRFRDVQQYPHGTRLFTETALDAERARANAAEREAKQAWDSHAEEVVRVEQAEERIADLEAALQPLVAAVEFADRLMPDIAQLLDGWHQDGTDWSEWDESVRERLSNLSKILENVRIARALDSRVQLLEGKSNAG
jgi:hypothetical protein